MMPAEINVSVDVLDAASVLFFLKFGGKTFDTGQPSTSSKEVNEEHEDKRDATKRKQDLENETSDFDNVPFWHESDGGKNKSFKREYGSISQYNDAVPGPSNSSMQQALADNRSSSNESELKRNGHVGSMNSIDDIRQSIQNFTRDLTRPEKIRTPDRKVTIYKEKGTQTDFEEIRPVNNNFEKVQNIEKKLILLYEKFHNLVRKMNLNENVSLGNDSTETTGTEQVNSLESIHNVSGSQAIKKNVGSFENNEASHMITEGAIESLKLSHSQIRNNNEVSSTKQTPERSIIKTETISLGKGNAEISTRLYNDINWASHTTATRQLLQAVFPRRVLATHSLTGKPSPAFLNRPPKKILDPKIIEDIVATVSEKCNVPEKLVRTCITIKCADEDKLYKNRQRGRSKQNDENLHPVANFEQCHRQPTP